MCITKKYNSNVCEKYRRLCNIMLLHQLVSYIDLFIPCSQKIWWEIKLRSFAVCRHDCQIKIRQYFLLAYIRMVIPYRTAKFKSVNIILAKVIWDPTAKFNSCQYFGYTLGDSGVHNITGTSTNEP